MVKDKRTGWLKNLKIGDRVFSKSNINNYLDEFVITNIAPTGKIKCWYDQQFDSNGNSIEKWNGQISHFLVETTEKIKEQYKKQIVIFYLKNWFRNLDRYDLSLLCKILEIIDNDYFDRMEKKEEVIKPLIEKASSIAKKIEK